MVEKWEGDMRLVGIKLTLGELLAECGEDRAIILRVAKYACIQRLDWESASIIRDEERKEPSCSPKTG